MDDKLGNVELGTDDGYGIDLLCNYPEAIETIKSLFKEMCMEVIGEYVDKNEPPYTQHDFVFMPSNVIFTDNWIIGE